jgi:hypothetical protein
MLHLIAGCMHGPRTKGNQYRSSMPQIVLEARNYAAGITAVSSFRSRYGQDSSQIQYITVFNTDNRFMKPRLLPRPLRRFGVFSKRWRSLGKEVHTQINALHPFTGYFLYTTYISKLNLNKLWTSSINFRLWSWVWPRTLSKDLELQIIAPLRNLHLRWG